MAQTHEGAEFERLLEVVRLERNFDFTGYKRSSVTGANADEFTRLLNTVLINVTSLRCPTRSSASSARRRTSSST
jgi:hypothetical protein